MNDQNTINLKEALAQRQKIDLSAPIDSSRQKIYLPDKNRPWLERLPKILFAIGFVIAVFVGFEIYMSWGGGEEKPILKEEKWYAVKLIDNQIVYGLVADTAADPVVIKNVYYNYEQLKSASSTVGEDSDIKLVKRGRETHGPAGSMEVVRQQIIYLEPLKPDSKVLSAILTNENK